MEHLGTESLAAAATISQGPSAQTPEPEVTSRSVDPRSILGSTIGPYRLLDLPGNGGMGVVYLAEQRAPLRRRVALKLIKRGMDTAEVIDFGVAKATNQPLTEKTVYTELGQIIGTPEYMIPEQAEMTTVDIDTRTDIYSLGVMLYELLVGALPFDRKKLREAGHVGLRKVIREKEPQKPSTRLSGLGKEDRHEGAREGPHAAVLDGVGSGGGHHAALGA